MPRASRPPCRAGGHEVKGEGIARGGRSRGAARCGGLVAPRTRLTGRVCDQRWDAAPMHRPMQSRPHANSYGWAVMSEVSRTPGGREPYTESGAGTGRRGAHAGPVWVSVRLHTPRPVGVTCRRGRSGRRGSAAPECRTQWSTMCSHEERAKPHETGTPAIQGGARPALRAYFLARDYTALIRSVAPDTATISAAAHCTRRRPACCGTPACSAPQEHGPSSRCLPTPLARSPAATPCRGAARSRARATRRAPPAQTCSAFLNRRLGRAPGAGCARSRTFGMRERYVSDAKGERPRAGPVVLRVGSVRGISSPVSAANSRDGAPPFHAPTDARLKASTRAANLGPARSTRLRKLRRTRA